MQIDSLISASAATTQSPHPGPEEDPHAIPLSTLFILARAERRAVFALVPLPGSSHPVLAVTGGVDKVGRFRLQVTSRDIRGRNVVGAGQGNGINFSRFMGRGPVLLGRFRRMDERSIRRFFRQYAEQLDRNANVDTSLLPGSCHSPTSANRRRENSAALEAAAEDDGSPVERPNVIPDGVQAPSRSGVRPRRRRAV